MFFVPFFDDSVKDENGAFGRCFLGFHMLRKSFLKMHKNEKRINFLIVKADGF